MSISNWSPNCHLQLGCFWKVCQFFSLSHSLYSICSGWDVNLMLFNVLQHLAIALYFFKHLFIGLFSQLLNKKWSTPQCNSWIRYTPMYGFTLQTYEAIQKVYLQFFPLYADCTRMASWRKLHSEQWAFVRDIYTTCRFGISSTLFRIITVSACKLFHLNLAVHSRIVS